MRPRRSLEPRDRIHSTAIRRAAVGDLEQLLPLFQAYLQFYGLAYSISNIEQFLEERLELQDTIVLIAWAGAVPVGFAHLLPSWSSLGLASIAILNDLFVAPAWRGQHVATALLKAAEREATVRGMTKLDLMTAVGNQRAQSLYRHQQWNEVIGFVTFEKSLPKRGKGRQ